MKSILARLAEFVTGPSRLGSSLLLLSIVGAVFGNALPGAFVWDDQIYLLNKPAYQHFDLRRIFLSLANDLEYLPVRDLSYALDWTIWGRRAFGFHLTNLIFFATTVLLVYRLTERLATMFQPQRDANHARATGLLCALLFAVHPIHAEVVSFITGRNALLAGFFSLLCCLAFLTYLEQTHHSRRYLLLALFWFVLALFSKATSIALPLVFVLLLLFRPDHWRRVALSMVPFLAIAAGSFYLFRTIASRSFLLPSEQNCFTITCLAQKLALAAQIPFFYGGKLLLPLGLTPEYNVDFPVHLLSLQVIVALVALAGFLAGAITLRRRQPLLAFGCGWYLLTMVPVLHFFPTYPTVADRYVYLPSFGFCLVVATVVTDQAYARRHNLLVAGTVAVILTLALLTGQQNLIWRSAETLWGHTIRTSPRSVKAYTNLGRIHFTAGRYAEAFTLFEQAHQLAPGDPHYDFFTGLRYFLRGDYSQALPHFSRAEARDPIFLETLFHTAMAYEALGNHAQAIDYFNRTIQSKQDDLGNFKATAREHLQRINSR